MIACLLTFGLYYQEDLKRLPDSSPPDTVENHKLFHERSSVDISLPTFWPIKLDKPIIQGYYIHFFNVGRKLCDLEFIVYHSLKQPSWMQNGSYNRPRNLPFARNCYHPFIWLTKG